jgi:hypothetical protein
MLCHSPLNFLCQNLFLLALISGAIVVPCRYALCRPEAEIRSMDMTLHIFIFPRIVKYSWHDLEI